MELIIYSVAIFITIGLLFLLLEHPYKLGAIIIFMVLYQFNVETPLPLDSRGLLTLLLFIRLYFFDRDNLALTNNTLLKNKYFWLIFVFLIILLVFPIINSERIILLMKDIVLAFVNVFLGFIFVKNSDGRKALVYGVILAGLLSSVDLLFTFFTTGSLQIIKITDTLLGREPVILNHNYPGLLASMALFAIYFLWYRSKIYKPFLVLLILFTSIAVIISTSRSTILAFVIVFILASIFEDDLKHNLKKIVPLTSVLIMLLVGFFFSYNLFFVSATQDSYLDKIYYRLYEEPYKMLTGEASEFDKLSGQRIKGSMTFRAERWQEDFNKFTRLPITNQILGLGPKGYLEIAERVYKQSGYLRHQLASHNGYLLILLERGAVGFIIFIFLIFSLSINAIKKLSGYENKIIFPMIYFLLMLAIYSFAQNSELTSPYTYLIIGAVIGNIIHTSLEVEHEAEVT
jgi:O-antigen ligase